MSKIGQYVIQLQEQGADQPETGNEFDRYVKALDRCPPACRCQNYRASHKERTSPLSWTWVPAPSSFYPKPDKPIFLKRLFFRQLMAYGSRYKLVRSSPLSPVKSQFTSISQDSVGTRLFPLSIAQTAPLCCRSSLCSPEASRYWLQVVNSARFVLFIISVICDDNKRPMTFSVSGCSVIRLDRVYEQG